MGELAASDGTAGASAFKAGASHAKTKLGRMCLFGVLNTTMGKATSDFIHFLCVHAQVSAAKFNWWNHIF